MTALHGFLGRPSDWDGVFDDRWTRLDNLRPVEDDLDSAAKRLNAQATGDVLLGYSLGGRLALHMLLQEPERWRQAIIVSASPGLSEGEDRTVRLANDARWAERFRHDPWDETVAAWNVQAVFSYDPPDRLPRPEREFDREAVARALTHYSVARQRDLRAELRGLAVPILWIAGARDAKYAALAEECAGLNPLFERAILNAGHRVPWGAIDAFRSAVERFITIKP